MITEPVISYFQALQSLVPDAKLYVEDNDWDRVNWSDEREQPSKAEVDVEIIRLQAEYDSQEYARNRASAYDSIGDQLDMIYKDNLNGTTTHKDSVEAVKAQYPKPS
tara:strand:- start:84 stop:404 length:321 start_codon:yes stop_codon:yes gene_type:complete